MAEKESRFAIKRGTRTGLQFIAESSNATHGFLGRVAYRMTGISTP